MALLELRREEEPMGKRYTVTERVVRDHPDGYQYVAAVPNDEIPYEQAVAWGLVEDEPVVTAEVRRSHPVKKAAAKDKSEE